MSKTKDEETDKILFKIGNTKLLFNCEKKFKLYEKLKQLNI